MKKLSNNPDPEYVKYLANKKINFHISVDCVIFGFDLKKLKVLLVDRTLLSHDKKNIIIQDHCLPGNFCRGNEDIHQSACRILKELTGLTDVHLEQFYAFGDLERLKKKQDQIWLKGIGIIPESRVVTVAYYSFVAIDKIPVDQKVWKRFPQWYERHPDWYEIHDLPELAFDHEKIIHAALNHLKERVITQSIIFKLLPEKFTLSQLQKIYEVILDIKLDKRNFRKKIMNSNFIIPLKERQIGVSNKPAQLFKFNMKKFEKRSNNPFNLCRF